MVVEGDEEQDHGPREALTVTTATNSTKAGGYRVRRGGEKHQTGNLPDQAALATREEDLRPHRVAAEDQAP